jgi:hypothetical protein
MTLIGEDNMTLIGEDNMADAKIYSVSEQSKLAKVRG